ncbi:MAG: hypothetical protein K6G75_08620 [Lachnospiraceae bacterium]|nr:hypothetical protein [Lachnospiraceae bacterium]
MRVATDEEDALLRNISDLQTKIYNTENDIMIYESQIKGYKEQRRQMTTKFFTVLFILAFVLLISFGYLIHLFHNPSLTIALFLGSGGLGFFATGFLIYSILYFIKYFASTSRTEFWFNMAEKMMIDNITGMELANSTKLIQSRNEVKNDRDVLDTKMKEYLDLKDKNDKIFKKELEAGTKKAGFNFEAFNSYTEVNNDLIIFNKKRVDLNILNNRITNAEKDIQDMFEKEKNCQKSIRLFFIALLLLILATGGLFVLSLRLSDSIELWMIHIAIVIFILILGIAVIIGAVNFMVNLPYVSDSGFAKLVADKLGLDHTKADLNDLIEQMKRDDEQTIRLKEEIQTLKKKINEDKE